jgi:hypothetical protein
MTRSNLAGIGFWIFTTLFSVALVGCGSSGDDVNASDSLDPLVGTWTFNGHPPEPVSITLTFNPDKTFVLVEEVEPASIPAGAVVDTGCPAATDTYVGTYAESVSGGTNMLTWTYTGGTANQFSGCNNPSNNSAGTPMKADDIAAFVAENMIPPTTLSYTVTSTTLVLPFSKVVGASTTFSKSP